MKLKKICFFVLIFINFSYVFGNTDLQKTKTEIEAELNYPLNFNISISHFLKFYRPNTESRYTELGFSLSLKPANLLGSFNLKLAYLPFINFIAGTALGTGWAYPALNFYGIAENQNVNNLQVIKPLYFSKLFLSTQGGIELYFDLNSQIKNEWANLILKTSHIINYTALIPLKNTYFWFFDNDLGENRNGARYAGTYSIEYNMPLYLNTIRIELISYKNLYKTIPFTKNKAEQLWTFELKNELFFKVSEKTRIKLQAVWKTAPIYYNYKDEAHFTQKIINSKKNIDMFFESVAISLIFKL
ncbi:hypothetical protein E4O03_05135 [Treponema sp. OMZ 792]|uniref:hypothetical protein n=1 Tax=unclassified Treponema TaxID=2638727 RepID=UPI0020A2E1CA|nr:MULTISPECIES: hypothetical protein [unclassified Treponema]UTC76091.1 hypothetical protein E4O03_05135 [Treponema sp. OMZ 792]UTC80092.1 hypothetical protein E4O07_05155 [Treponema sp. OMZ 798]